VNCIFNNFSFYYHYVFIEHAVLKNTWVKLYMELYMYTNSFFILCIEFVLPSCMLTPHNTGCFKKSFTNLKAYRNLYRGDTQRFELSKCSKTHRVLPPIVIRNCFDLFFRFLLYGTSTVTPTPKSNAHGQIHDTFHARGTEDIHNVLNSQNVAKRTEFYLG
jgi:hypothetical protein